MHTYTHADFHARTEDEKFTPLHFAARYQPRYHDDDIQQQEDEEDVDSGPSQTTTRDDVSYLASSKRITKLLVENFQVDVCEAICIIITKLCIVAVAISILCTKLSACSFV